jgi:hypothetical protein
MRFIEPQGHTEEPPVPPRQSTRSTTPPPYTSIYSSYGFIILSEEEAKRLSRLEKRLVPATKHSTTWVSAPTYTTCWGT